MRLGEIIYMNVITNAGAVRGPIIGTEDLHCRTFAACCLQRQWDQVSFRLVPFPDFTAFIRAGGIEVTHPRGAQRVSIVISFQRLFKKIICSHRRR